MNARPRPRTNVSPRPAAYLTVRRVPAQVARALRALQRRSGASLNQVVIDVLARALGVDAPSAPTNGLEELAGGWSEEDHAAFEATQTAFEQIDAELWR